MNHVLERSSRLAQAMLGFPPGRRQRMGKALVAWLLVTTAVAAPVGPRDVVQAAVARVVIAMQKAEGDSVDATPTKRLAAEQRRAEIRRVAADLFDFDEMSRRVLS